MNKHNIALPLQNKDSLTITTIKKTQLIICTFLALVVANFSFQIVKYLSEYDTITQTPATNHTVTLSVTTLLMSGLVSPFIEETVFRGILLNYFSTYYLKTSVIVLSLIFASLHLDWFFYPYFFSSLILSYSYLKSGKDLKISFIVHALYNCSCLLIVYLN